MLNWRNTFFAMAEQHPAVAIDRYLLSPEQRRFLMDSRLTIADVLTGRYPASLTADIEQFLFHPWNEALGTTVFQRRELGALTETSMTDRDAAAGVGVRQMTGSKVPAIRGVCIVSYSLRNRTYDAYETTIMVDYSRAINPYDRSAEPVPEPVYDIRDRETGRRMGRLLHRPQEEDVLQLLPSYGVVIGGVVYDVVESGASVGAFADAIDVFTAVDRFTGRPVLGPVFFQEDLLNHPTVQRVVPTEELDQTPITDLNLARDGGPPAGATFDHPPDTGLKL